jgi:hypothetical protein
VSRRLHQPPWDRVEELSQLEVVDIPLGERRREGVP